MHEFRVHRWLSYYLKIPSKRGHCPYETKNKSFFSHSRDISKEGVFKKASLYLYQIGFNWAPQRRGTQERKICLWPWGSGCPSLPTVAQLFLFRDSDVKSKDRLMG